MKKRKSPRFVAAALAVALTGAVSAQSFNIDIGPPGIAPPATYAGAGQAGHWMKVPGTQGVVVSNLVDVNGQVTGASFNQIGGTETVTIADPDLSGPDATLMNDCLLTHSTVENCIFMSGMEPGDYEVIVYARMPAADDVFAKTNVDQEPANPDYIVGGPWSGDHELLVTYSIHPATVAASGPQAGKLGLHSGVAPGGSLVVGAALNGFQVRKVEPVAGDVDGDGLVDFTDLLAVLAAWGPCAACPEDLDGSGAVDFGDLLAVLGNWS